MNEWVEESLDVSEDVQPEQSQDFATDLDRRQALARLGLGASIAYATPVLLTLSNALAISSDDDDSADDGPSDGDDDGPSDGDDDGPSGSEPSGSELLLP